MPQINLAPESQYLLAIRRRQNRIYYIALFIIVLFLITWAGFVFTENSYQNNLSQAQDDLAAVNTQLAAMGEKASRVSSFEHRTRVLGELLNRRVSWAPVYNELEKLLPAPAILTHMEVDITSSEIKFSGFAPTLDDIAQTLASISSSNAPNKVFISGSVTAVKNINQQTTEDAPANNVKQFSGTILYNPTAIKVNQPL